MGVQSVQEPMLGLICFLGLDILSDFLTRDPIFFICSGSYKLHVPTSNWSYIAPLSLPNKTLNPFLLNASDFNTACQSPTSYLNIQ